MAGYKEKKKKSCWQSRGVAGYKETLVGIPKRRCARSRGVAGYKEKVAGGVGEWPATKKKLWAE